MTKPNFVRIICKTVFCSLEVVLLNIHIVTCIFILLKNFFFDALQIEMNLDNINAEVLTSLLLFTS